MKSQWVRDMMLKHATGAVASLPYDADVKADILSAANQNFVVNIPDSDLAYMDWTGTGYIKENTNTSEAGYMLSGALAGGMTVSNVMSRPTDEFTAFAEAYGYPQAIINPGGGDPRCTAGGFQVASSGIVGKRVAGLNAADSQLNVRYSVQGSKAVVYGVMGADMLADRVYIESPSGNAAAYVNSSNFAAVVPLAAGTNILNAVAEDQLGNTVSSSVSVIGPSTQSQVTLSASSTVGYPDAGGRPRQNSITFSAALANGLSPVKYEWDFDGDGRVDLECATAPNATAIFTNPGIYLPTVTVTDASGNRYTDTIVVTVLDFNDTEAVLKTIWSSVRPLLMNGNIDTALNYFTDPAKENYRSLFALKGTLNLYSLLANATEMELESVTDQSAYCGVIRKETRGTYSYPVIFIKDDKGLWKINTL